MYECSNDKCIFLCTESAIYCATLSFKKCQSSIRAKYFSLRRKAREIINRGSDQQRLRKKKIDIEWRLLPSIHCYVSLRVRFYLVDRINVHNILFGITWKSSSNLFIQDKFEDSQNVNRIKNK